MQEKKQIKGDIKYLVQLNDEQKEAKRLIYENQIVIVTGQAGSGKSLVCAQVALDFLFKKKVTRIFNTRAAIEVGKTLGFMPGGLKDKFDPYMEAFKENLYKCYDGKKIDELITEEKIKALPVQFIRGKTVDDILVCEEIQNMTPGEVEAIITRLGKTGTIILNGDAAQRDTNIAYTGLDWIIELSKNIPEIKWIKLKENHRSGLVGKILDYIYKNKTNE
jgi:phosphate starvation-inducible protein PhoH